MLKEYDRKKQKFWILSRGNPWQVLNMADNSFVCDIDKEIAYDIEEEFLLVESKEELDELIKKSKARIEVKLKELGVTSMEEFRKIYDIKRI